MADFGSKYIDDSAMHSLWGWGSDREVTDKLVEYLAEAFQRIEGDVALLSRQNDVVSATLDKVAKRAGIEKTELAKIKKEAEKSSSRQR